MRDQISAIFGDAKTHERDMYMGEVNTKIHLWTTRPDYYTAVIINGVRCDTVEQLQAHALVMGIT